MTVYATESLNSSDVIKWIAHPGFCYISDDVSVGDGVALVRGDELAGRVVRGGPGAWVLVDTGDTITPGTTVVGIIASDKKITANAATGAALGKCAILTQGPAIVHNDGLSAGGLASMTNVLSALALKNIKVVDELGEQVVLPAE